MKREIKFNAWDGKRMLKNVGVHPHMIKSLVKIPNCENQDSDCEYKKDTEGSIIVCQKFSAYTLLQFTGLLDKNGKEIYEGDIVLFEDAEVHNTENGRDFNEFINKGEIVWDKEEARFGVTDCDSVEWSDLTGNGILDVKVIGNIYENPELLKA